MRHRFFSICVTLFTLLLTPALALAEDEPVINARLQGYKQAPALPEASTTLTWFAFILLAGFCVAVLFKSSKRTHLD